MVLYWVQFSIVLQGFVSLFYCWLREYLAWIIPGSYFPFSQSSPVHCPPSSGTWGANRAGHGSGTVLGHRAGWLSPGDKADKDTQLWWGQAGEEWEDSNTRSPRNNPWGLSLITSFQPHTSLFPLPSSMQWASCPPCSSCTNLQQIFSLSQRSSSKRKWKSRGGQEATAFIATNFSSAHVNCPKISYQPLISYQKHSVWTQ